MPMTSTSLSSSAPSTKMPQKEQKLEKVVMIAPKEPTSNNKDDIETQVIATLILWVQTILIIVLSVKSRKGLRKYRVKQILKTLTKLAKRLNIQSISLSYHFQKIQLHHRK